MINLAKCRWCGKEGHLIDYCPDRVSPTKPKVSPTLKVSKEDIIEQKKGMSGWERNKKWRKEHRDEYNAGMREFRAKRRKRSA